MGDRIISALFDGQQPALYLVRVGTADRRVDGAVIRCDKTVHYSQIALLHLTALHLADQSFLHEAAFSHDQEAGGVHVEAVAKRILYELPSASILYIRPLAMV